MLKKSVSVLLALLSAIGMPLAVPAAASADTGYACQSVTVPVALSPTNSTTVHIAGQLCGDGALAGKTVQVLVHGFTYDRNYWDFPFQPGAYSYARHAADEGYAVFMYDRLGSGLSDHPLSTNVTLESNAFELHELIEDLRSGAIGGVSFPKVMTVGHSAGSGYSLYEASTYADVDGVILSGFAHQFNFLDAGFFTSLEQANTDPKFSGAGLDDGYITTAPGTRGDDFYNTAVANPSVIALDESLKQTGTLTEQITSQALLAPNVSLQIHVPVLLAIGQNDTIFCNDALALSCADSQAILNRESAFFAPQACLEAFVLPTSGHDVNLHPNARDWFKAANSWSDRRVGSSASSPATQPCD